MNSHIAATSKTEAISSIVGSENILKGREAEEYAVDGEKPQFVVFPDSVEKVSRVLRFALENGLAVVPWGGGTRMHVGYPLDRMDIVVCLSHLNKVVEYNPDDMTIVVEAGITLSELQKVLAERRQFLPLDPPYPELASLGGIIATDSSGVLRLGYGTVRDYLIGIKVVQPNGDVTRFGSKVVKSVAGYDLMKLYTGSLGTLGVIVEGSFKVCPLPEVNAILAVSMSDIESADHIFEVLVHADLQPVLVELVSKEAVERLPILSESFPEEEYVVVLGFSGFKEDVDWQLQELEKLLSGMGLSHRHVFRGEEESDLRQLLCQFQAPPGAFVTCKANLLPSNTTLLCHYAKKLSNEHRVPCALMAHAMSGIVYVHWFEPPAPLKLPELTRLLLSLAKRGGGNLVVERAPVDLKPSLPLWGEMRDDLKLMRALKEALDPARILNPGRYVGGI